MAYKLDKKWFIKNGFEKVQLKSTTIDFVYKNVVHNIASNQSVLKELYEMGKEYVTCGEAECDIEKKCCTKNKELDGIKEKPVKKEAKQVSKASKKK